MGALRLAAQCRKISHIVETIPAHCTSEYCRDSHVTVRYRILSSLHSSMFEVSM
jgi:hypothetical protein